MTENLRKEQLSVAYLRTVAGLAGFSLAVPELDDDSVDLQLQASGDFHPSSPRLDVQLKATADSAAVRQESIAWRLKRKNYDDLRRVTSTPRLLVVLVLPADPGHWFSQTEVELVLRNGAYWLSLRGAPAMAQETVTVYLPRVQLFSPDAVRHLMIDSMWRPGA